MEQTATPRQASVVVPGQAQAEKKLELAVIKAEKFKARIAPPSGMNFYK